MSRKFTVSVSDELGAKIDRWKGKISPSGVFQEAMEKVIEEKEGFRKRLEENMTMEATIERLRKQKAEHENTHYEEGKNEGLMWARAASYPILRYVAEVFAPVFSQDNKVHYNFVYRCDHELLREDLVELLKEYHDTTQNGDDEYLPDAAYKLLEGWCDAVVEFWDEVSDKL